MTDGSNTGTDIVATRLNLLDLPTSSDTGSSAYELLDNKTAATSYTLKAYIKPNQKVMLLDNGVDIGVSATADTNGWADLLVSGASSGVHKYTLLDITNPSDTANYNTQITLNPGDYISGAAVLTVTVDGTAVDSSYTTVGSLITPTMQLLSDTGSAGDGVTNTGTVNVLLSGVAIDSSSIWQMQQDGGNWTTMAGSTFTLTAGVHTYAVRQVTGLMTSSTPSAVATWTLDSDAPVLSLSSDLNLVNHLDSVSVTANEACSLYLVKSSALTKAGALPTLSELQAVASDSKVLSTVDTAHAGQSVSVDTTGLTEGAYQLYAIDTAGNVSVAGGTSTPTSISVSEGWKVTLSDGTFFGNLIKPTVSSGVSYYGLDSSDDGVLSSSDFMTPNAVDLSIAGAGRTVSDVLRSITLSDGLHKAQLLSVSSVVGSPRGDFSSIMPVAGTDPSAWPLSAMSPYFSSTLTGVGEHLVVSNNSGFGPSPVVADNTHPYFISMAVLPV